MKQEEIDDVLQSLKAENFSLEAICNYLFSDSAFSTDIMKKFEHLAGQEVNWTGTLENAQKFFSDFTFKDKTGTKATIKLYELTDKFGIKTPVKAIVQFETDDYDYLNSKRSEPIEFIGKLLKIEAFSKEIYLSDGVINKT